jgi:hypothetical protein
MARAVIRVRESSCRWWLGDLYRWPVDDELLATLRSATEADNWIGPKWETFQSYGSVAKAFPIMTRVKAVSFKHHRVMMALPTEQRAELLAWAAKEKVSVRGLEAEVKRRSFAVIEAVPEPIAEANELVDLVKAVLADQSPAQVIDGAELELKRLTHALQAYLSAWGKTSEHAAVSSRSCISMPLPPI